MSSLLLKKLGLAFVLGFAPVLLLGLVDLTSKIQESTSSGDVDSTAWGWFLVSLLAGAVSAGLRAIIVAFNFMPTDQLHSPNSSDATSVTVTKES
jgi:hypothetical protein